jgi:competence protein ComEC
MDPFQAIDPGFALSVAATAGILLLAPKLEIWLTERFGHEKFAQVIAIPLAATFMCTPIILAISGLFSLVSIPANVLAGPVVAPITIIGFIAALLSPIIPSISHALLVAIKPLAQFIVWISNSASELPVLMLPKSYLGAVIAILVIGLIKFKKWLALFLLLIIATLIIVLPGSWPGSNWAVANCNVGQGDGLAINLGNNEALVIDLGPDSKLMNECLGDLGVKRIPLLVLSHFHADHVHGLDGALAGRDISNVWVSIIVFLDNKNNIISFVIKSECKNKVSIIDEISFFVYAYSSLKCIIIWHIFIVIDFIISKFVNSSH